MTEHEQLQELENHIKETLISYKNSNDVGRVLDLEFATTGLIKLFLILNKRSLTQAHKEWKAEVRAEIKLFECPAEVNTCDDVNDLLQEILHLPSLQDTEEVK